MSSALGTTNVTFNYDTDYNRLTSIVDGIGTNVYSYYSVTNGTLGAGQLQSGDGPFNNDLITYAYDKVALHFRTTLNVTSRSSIAHIPKCPLRFPSS